MKRLKLLFGTLFLAFAVVASFAFTADDFHAPNATQCFAYSTSAPNSAPNVTAPGNYTASSNPLNCPQQRVRLCGICFDTNTYPLVDGKPDFSIPALQAAVDDNYEDIDMHGVSIGSGTAAITLYFRNQP